MNKSANLMFTDEALRFLYSSPMFQKLDEQEQVRFLQTFQSSEKLHKLLKVAVDIQLSILEMEALVPSILEKDFAIKELLFYHEQLKANVEKRDNVYYVPFAQKLKSPYVVLLQQSEDMENYSTYMTGLILPLLNVCAKQKRDLIVVPFQEEVQEVIVFGHGLAHVDCFAKLMQLELNGQANITPALVKATEIFAEDSIQQQPELFIVTNNQFLDDGRTLYEQFAEQLQILQVETSVVAISEQQFEQQPILFAQKTFFVDEHL